MRKLILLIALLAAVPAFAQERPIAGTTVQTTDTTANSVLAGCAVGSTTCTGGVKAGLVTLATGQAGATGPTVYANATQLVWAGGSAGYLWNATNNSTALMTLTNAGLLTLSGSATHAITATFNSTLGWTVTNSSNGGSANSAMSLVNDGGTQGILMQAGTTYTGVAAYQAATALRGTAANGIHIAAEHASGGIKFYTGGTNLRWGINSAGDHLFGASSHISDSSGTPVIASGFGSGANTIAGADYAFVVNSGGAAGVTGTVTFGHTWSTAPVCVAANSAASSAIVIGTTTTTVTLTVGTGTLATPVYVLCRGY